MKSTFSLSNMVAKTSFVLTVAVAAALISPLASAESNFQTGTGTLTATARLDFQITIPRILFLQVGTGTAFAANPTIDLVSFAPTAAQIATPTAVASTPASVAARLVGNGGPISLTATTTGPLTTGTAGETISWTQISAASSSALTHPALVDSGAGAATNFTAKVNNLSANWTFTFTPPTVPPAAGTYGGPGSATAGVNGGRVLYTASMP